MKEDELIKILKTYKPEPNKKWQERTLHILNNLPVTEEKEKRNSSISIVNLLNKHVMDIKLKAGIAIVTTGVLLTGSMLTVYASNDANPGDFLFPLDLAVENIQRTFLTNPVAKSEFELKIMDERILELTQLSLEKDTTNTVISINEVDAQQIRLKERLQEMDQLRTQDKLQAEEELKVLEQLRSKLKINDKTLDQVQQQLNQNGNQESVNKLDTVQNEYTKQMETQINGFEQSTGLTVNESEQNAGEDTQIQNQNQIQNGTITPTNGNGTQDGNGSGNGTGNNTVTPQQNGGSQQQNGKN